MEPEVLPAKMESLSRCIHRVESRRPDRLEELIDNLDTQDILPWPKKSDNKRFS
jgi:hypothetical protein